MSTVSHASRYFQDAFAGDLDPAYGRFTDAGFDRARKPLEAGCPAELFLGADDDRFDDDALALAAEVDAAAAEWETVTACERADAAHVAELRKAHATAKKMFGVAKCIASRSVSVGEETSVRYFAMLDGRGFDSVCGVGETAAAAVDDAAQRLDEKYGIVPEFGGFKVTGLAFVGGAFERPREDALRLARRIALSPEYLDAALALRMPAVTDLRPRSMVAVAAA